MASRDRERDRELLIPVFDSPDLDIASKPSSSSSASSSHHSGRECRFIKLQSFLLFLIMGFEGNSRR
ncbi:hypothetical protein DKX38_018727 [Salix brachista]|uniref:Uncharacterized protein n=1 Tax=Salix brachista TaxID=2182728 RepID=A0A5N5KNZ4_9ROSI|nr:hypothetical protein DKX38_018727 [Salix brachista]